MRAWVELCLRQRVVVLALALVLVALGAVVTERAAYDAFPEFAPPRVEVQTEAPGLASEEVESLVTTPLEGALMGTTGATEVRSRSVLGLSSVVLLFAPGTDLLEARALVTERVARAQLPAVARPPVVLAPQSSTSRVLKVAVWSGARSQMELTDLIQWVARPRLMSIPGVANVAVWGSRRRELQVLVDPVRLEASGVSLDAVRRAVSGAVAAQAGGFVDGPVQRLPVTHAAVAERPAELGALPIDPAAGAAGSIGALSLADVAEVVEAPAPPIGDAVVTGGEGLLLVVEKEPGANTLEVTRAVEDALAELRTELPGVELDPTVFRPAGFIERALHNLGEALAIGTGLVVLILVLFLWDWRTAAISVVAIPISLLSAASVLALTGRTLDTMAIAGLIIALGEVVDDAIIDVENIHRRLREHRPEGPAAIARVVLEASLEVRSAVVFATMIVVLVVLPVLFLPGPAGEFFRPLAISYGLAVSASMLVALTLTPVLSLWLLPAHVGRREPPFALALRRVYGAALRATLARPRLVLVFAGAMFVGTIVGAFGLQQAFLPEFAENDFLMHWIGKPGSSLEAMARSTDRVRAELLAVPGVRNFGAHIGRAEGGDEIVGPNFAELWVSVDPEADLEQAMQEIERVVQAHPGVYRDVETYLEERMNEVLTGGSAAIVVRLTGADLDTLRSAGETLAERLGAIAGVEHASPAAQVFVPQIEIHPRVERCAALGIDVGTVRARAAALIRGERLGTLVRDQQPIDVVIWSTPEQRADVAAVGDLVLEIDPSRRVRLGDVAEVRVVPMRNTVEHVGGSRKLDVTVSLAAGADLAVVADAIRGVVDELGLPAGYGAQTLGTHRARSEAQRRLLGVGALALLGIFLVLYADFRSLRTAGLVMSSLPLALVGGVGAVVLSGGVVSLGTLVGFVTVLGIAARNGILLIAHYRHLETEEGAAFGLELLLRGAEERLAPILMTALSTGLALVPLAIGGHSAGHEIEHPMALVILGGLLSSTLLNLFVMPVVVMLSRGAALRRA